MAAEIITARMLVDEGLRFIAQDDRRRDEKIDEREFRRKMDQVANDMAKIGLFENMKLGDRSVQSHFITTFPGVEVKFDEDQELYYSDQPASFISLPHNKGINLICPMKDRRDAFVICDPNGPSAYASSPAGKLGGRKGVWPEMNRFYYTHNLQDLEIAAVLVRLVIADATAIAPDAPYPVPPDMRFELVNRTCMFYLAGNQFQPDTANDNLKPAQTQKLTS